MSDAVVKPTGARTIQVKGKGVYDSCHRRIAALHEHGSARYCTI